MCVRAEWVFEGIGYGCFLCAQECLSCTFGEKEDGRLLVFFCKAR